MLPSNRKNLEPLDWEGQLRREVPKPLVAAAAVAGLALVVLAVFQVTYGSYSDELGFQLLSKADMATAAHLRPQHLRSARVQKLADEDSEETAGDEGNNGEEEKGGDVIRFEDDYKVGGGDLEVPVSMVDYENLGEGSIVDQRYPRKLPGQDEMEAELGSLFTFDWGDTDKASTRPLPGPEDNTDNEAKLAKAGVNVDGHHYSKKRFVQAEQPGN
mmetsp:Transcript_3513/g.5606  ORF Transcript_3513/g.5606 Transcript_3513/m.5606 type:complete len:215 (-) Transcript_3513:190-834(-)